MRLCKGCGKAHYPNQAWIHAFVGVSLAGMARWLGILNGRLG